MKKSLVQKVRQNRDISECRRAHLTTKINTTFFITSYMLNIFLFNNFFEKKPTIFEENCEKRFGGIHI